MSLNFLQKRYSWLGTTLLLISLTVVSPVALAADSCAQIFENVSKLGLYPTPKPIQYYSTEGVPRLFTDKGEILQLVEQKWTPIGLGKFNNGVIVEQVRPEYQDRVDPISKKPIYKVPRLGRIKNIQGFMEIKKMEEQRYYWNSQQSRLSMITTLIFRGHRIEIIVPKGPSEKYIEGIKKMVLELPLGRIHALNKVTLNPESYRKNGYFKGIKEYAAFGFVDAAMAAGDGEISIFSGSMLKNVLGGDSLATAFIFHEFGHLLSESLFGSTTPSDDYIYFVKDENAMTDYAATNWSEDFAESLMEYMKSSGDPNSIGFRKTHGKRFGYFDRIFRYQVKQLIH